MLFPAMIPKYPSVLEHPTLFGKKRKELVEVIYYTLPTIVKVLHLPQSKGGGKDVGAEFNGQEQKDSQQRTKADGTN